MSILSSLARAFGASMAGANGSAYRMRQQVDIRIAPTELPAAALYALLRAFDLSNGLYDDLARANITIGRPSTAIKAIRNPVPAICDAWAAKLWPEPLTIETDQEAIVDPIETVWRWSNWRARRPMVARWVALYGEAWIKVQADQARGRVWFEYLDPRYVTDFEEDARGFVQLVRVDIPKTDVDATGARRLKTHTEAWSTAEQTYRRWETEGDASQRNLSDLGTPAEEEAFSTFGIDFTPFVRVPFSDSGEVRGVGAVQRAIEAIVEADISATNLHSMLYQDAEGAWVATAAGVDGSGRPIPPLQIGAATPAFDTLGRQTSNGTGTQSDGSISVGKRSFYRLPGGYDLKSVVADIDYTAALGILQDHDVVLERLCPALAYARISELSGGDLSGRAIRFKLTPFVDQVTGVRATALEKLAQADAMALTLGQANGIADFESIGSYDDGDFEHTFADVDVIPIGEYERAQSEREQATAYATWNNAGLPMVENLIRAGYTETDATRIVRLATQDAEAAFERQQSLLDDQAGDGEQQGNGGAS